jgi:hypothetical protein
MRRMELRSANRQGLIGLACLVLSASTSADAQDIATGCLRHGVVTQLNPGNTPRGGRCRGNGEEIAIEFGAHADGREMFKIYAELDSPQRFTAKQIGTFATDVEFEDSSTLPQGGLNRCRVLITSAADCWSLGRFNVGVEPRDNRFMLAGEEAEILWSCQDIDGPAERIFPGFVRPSGSSSSDLERGLAITDDGEILRIIDSVISAGMFDHACIIGVEFEYLRDFREYFSQ